MKRGDRGQGKRLAPGDTVRWSDGGLLRTWRVESVGRKYVHIVTGGHDLGGGFIAPVRRKRLTPEQIIHNEGGAS